MINKNKEEIEKIKKDILIEQECKYKNDSEEKTRLHTIVTLKNILKERIKTSILWCEAWIKWFEVRGLKGFSELYEQLQTHLTWLKEQDKES